MAFGFLEKPAKVTLKTRSVGKSLSALRVWRASGSARRAGRPVPRLAPSGREHPRAPRTEPVKGYEGLEKARRTPRKKRDETLNVRDESVKEHEMVKRGLEYGARTLHHSRPQPVDGEFLRERPTCWCSKLLP